ncbi:hypothetical protein PSH03_006180 [Micromonospora sp. PSH03]|uniref:hypothetical protein n=1 Tax=Micromonospora TaxID=1873 RepID=UPI001B381E12|nr:MULTISPECIES: hypothetical protein [Micromonospora]MBQ0993671.1 hypothetical protein [Micromonospora sp. H61]MCG5455111.1 hypothetical protein [Micromonospora salmantinae]
MRQEEQQVSNDHPEAVRSAPVPVPPAGDRAGHSDVPEDALDDRGTFDDQTATHERADDEGGFHEPGPLPTTFGATTVADAVAASALASPHPQDQPDPRAERTAQPGDGAEDGEREGLRADPTAELHRRDAYVDGGADVDDRTDLDDRTDADTSARTVVPPGSTDGDPERRGDLTGDRDATTAGAAGYGSATPEMVDPDADGEPVPGDDTSPTLESAGTSRPTGSTVAAEPATLLDRDTAQGFRDRWRDVQLRFVDDPQGAAGEAQSLVEEAIQALSSALAAQKNTLGGWQDAGSADTEQLRMAVRNYRDFLDRVLGR